MHACAAWVGEGAALCIWTNLLPQVSCWPEKTQCPQADSVAGSSQAALYHYTELSLTSESFPEKEGKQPHKWHRQRIHFDRPRPEYESKLSHSAPEEKADGAENCAAIILRKEKEQKSQKYLLQETEFAIVVLRQSHWGVKTGLELSILLPQPAACWHYRCVLPHLARYRVLFVLLHMVIDSENQKTREDENKLWPKWSWKLGKQSKEKLLNFVMFTFIFIACAERTNSELECTRHVLYHWATHGPSPPLEDSRQVFCHWAIPLVPPWRILGRSSSIRLHFPPPYPLEDSRRVLH